MKLILKTLVAAAVFGQLVTAQAFAYDSDKSWTVKGQAVTGTNRLLGKPTTDYGAPLHTTGFFNLAAFDPNSDQHEEISEYTSADALIATGVDPNFANIAGLPESLIDPSLNNVPMADVPVNISPDGETRASLPSTLDVDPLVPNRAFTSNNVTLKEWLKAKGKSRFECSPEGNSVSIRVNKLLPNRLYTVWAIFETADAQFAAVPFGGVPNVIATDGKGRGKFHRELGFCPSERTQDGHRLLAVDVVYHSDHMIYGQTPDLALKSLITGTVSHTHLEFTVQGTSLLD